MRKDRLLKERDHDPYSNGKKFPEGTRCPECGCVYINNRWSWPSYETEVPREEHLCPACRRIRDDYPAGELFLSGNYFREHKEQILNLINNILKEEHARSPLKRLVRIEDRGDLMYLTFTDDHVTRRVGEAIHKAHKGELEINYSEEDRFVRIHWKRN